MSDTIKRPNFLASIYGVSVGASTAAVVKFAMPVAITKVSSALPVLQDPKVAFCTAAATALCAGAITFRASSLGIAQQIPSVFAKKSLSP